MLDIAKIFSLPYSIAYALGFVALFYFIPLLTLRTLKYKSSIWGQLIERLRYPLLWIVLAITALIALQLLNFSDSLKNKCEHGIHILMIIVLGWLSIGVMQTFYASFVSKMQGASALDLEGRTLLTRVLLLYRLAIFVILAVTSAAILLTFPYIKNVGFGILGSAGVAGLVLGIAAKPILLNLLVGFQIAFSKVIKIGDAVFVENELARIESIHLTCVVVCTGDLRRIVIPVVYFIDKPFQNWDLTNSELIGYVHLYCDYTVPVGEVRKQAEELIKNHPQWNGNMWNVLVTDASERAVQIRVAVSAKDASAAFELRAYLREKLIDFLQKNYPSALPCTRTCTWNENESTIS